MSKNESFLSNIVRFFHFRIVIAQIDWGIV